MSDELLHFSHEAMAAPFEVIITGEDATYARQAADAVFAEVDLIEKALSRFLESSDISQINHLAPGAWARLGIHALECLKVAARVNAETGGAFDVTIGPLMALWRNPDKSPRQPSAEDLANARARVGMALLERDDKEHSVRVKTAGVQVDLGAIGKGYAVNRAAEILKEWSIESALINAGNSSTFAVGHLPDKDGWPVGVGGAGDEKSPAYVLQLCEKSLSGSGVHIKGSHIMDPRSGRPVAARVAAWALHPSGAVADGLSTAFMIMAPEVVEAYCQKHPDTCAMLILEGSNERLRFGDWKRLDAQSA
jgi:thiamine biosynthesis lipoprotein